MIPKAGGKPPAGEYDDLIPKSAQWRVPPANEGPREKINLSPQTDLPSRPTGPMDPSIAARQPGAQTPLEGVAVEKKIYAMLKADPAGTLKKIGAATVEEAKGMVMSMSPGALTRLAQKAGAETAANTATPETAGEVANLAPLGLRGAPGQLIKSPAIRTADGRIVEGPNHEAIKAAGTEGEEGFTTGPATGDPLGQSLSGRGFVNRKDGAAIAAANKQAPEDVEELHSQDLRPQPAGAMATSKAVLEGYKAVPPTPTKALVQGIEDGGQRLRGAATNDKATWQQYVDKLPPELKDSALQQKFYEFNEDGMKFGPENKILNLPQQELFKKFALPVIQENRDLYGELKKFNPEMFKEFDPDYVHRTVKGKTREFDPWMGEAGEANPMGGYRSRTAPSAKERVYYAIENERGVRKVVAITDHGAMVVNKGEPATPLPRYQGQATAPGDKFSINGENWSVKQAKTSEIEAHTDLKYYKNSMAGAIKNNMQLKAAVRAVNEVNRIKQTPEFEAYTVPLGREPPKGYVVPEFPPFRTRWMDPKMAAAIDSFWTAPKTALGQRIAAINRYMLQTLFWSPLIHAGNVGTHWFVSRGFEWLNPMGYARLAKTFPEAVVEVVTQGEKYKEMLRDGAGLVYGSVANEAFHRKMLQGLGEQITREPWKWDPIARVFGIGPSDLVKAIYGASSRTLWATSDAFMMQRVLELRLKGMTKLDSIEEAERHIPNYRIPSQVLNSTMVANRLKDPSLFAFTRYDYGVFKSYAEMAKDLATGDPKTRLKAIGNVMALGFLTYYVWPYISQGLQNLTGDKDIEFGPRGALKLPMLMRDLATGGKGLGDIIPSLITMSPVVNMAIQGLSGFRDHFGRPIAEQGDWQRGRYGRVGAQVGEQIAQDMNPLYGEAAQGMEDRKTGGLRGAGERILRQGVGVRKTPKPYFGRTGGGTYEQQSNYRQTHPRGPIEQLEKRAEQWLKQ